MKIINIFTVIALALLSFNCNQTDKIITNAEDYNVYLNLDENKELELTKADLHFWTKKLEAHPNQFPYLSKISASQSQIFNKTGQIASLIEAENSLIQVNETTHYNKAGYLRALARNYISQHKFKPALDLLKKAEAHGEGLESSQKMLFDINLELGDFETAKVYLEKFKDFSDFDYLIRLSKWSDHRGDLDAAIKYMEQAKTIAEHANIPATKQWVYTNLADYYGHAGEISNSYIHYLKALELDPEDAYAKKGIAWIVYSHEKNADEAMRILNSITKTYNAPDYFLLKAELAEYLGDNILKEELLKLYKTAVNNPQYGVMYNKYNALLYAENKATVNEALEIAYQEIENRPTPQSYDLLAWSLYNDGKAQKALGIMEIHVVGHTSEPDVLLHLAQIYKANGKLKEAQALKAELDSSIFELGPLTAVAINTI